MQTPLTATVSGVRKAMAGQWARAGQTLSGCRATFATFRAGAPFATK